MTTLSENTTNKDVDPIDKQSYANYSVCRKDEDALTADLFVEIMKPFGKVKWLIAQKDKFNMGFQSFVAAIEFTRRIDLNQPYGTGAFWNTHGSGINTYDTNPVSVSVRNKEFKSQWGTYYMHPEAAILSFDVRWEKYQSDYPRKPKEYYTLEDAKKGFANVMTQIFEKGLYKMDSKFYFVDWRNDKKEAESHMKSLADWWFADLYFYTEKYHSKTQQ